jgi:hypothetical protein
MRIMCRERSEWRAAGPWLIFLGLITLLLLPATARGQSGWGPEVPQPSRHLASRPVSGLRQNLPLEPTTSGWLSSRCPLPPASVFSLQTNFRKYLETWPTPGSTATEDWPEYIPEDEDNLN